MSPDVSSVQGPPHLRLARLMDGYLVTQLLYVAAKLGVADVLAEGPQTADDVAAAVGADAPALRRVLRGLAAEGVLDELPDGRLALTDLGACLREGASGSQRGAAIVRGDLYFRAASDLIDAVREGGVAFERAYGDDLFGVLAQRPELGVAFRASMTDRSRREADNVVASYDFRAFRRLVDVGGGTGVLLVRILAVTPGLRGVLVDRPAVIEVARGRLEAAGVADRCDLVASDFFEEVPPGGDAYLLSRVLHVWDDADAIRILTNCRRAMGDGGTLLLVEAILPELARDSPAAIRMDLHMLMLLHGRERTGAEYERLLIQTGFSMNRVVPTTSPVGLGIVEAVASPVGEASRS